MRSRSAQLLNLEDAALVLGIGRSSICRVVRDGNHQAAERDGDEALP